MSVKYDKLSVKELVELRSGLDAAIEAAKVREKQALLAKLHEQASSAGFTLKEIFNPKGRTHKLSGRTVSTGREVLRNPANPSQTWTAGVGRPPRWVSEMRANG